MNSSSIAQKLIVTGEDEESEGEIDIEYETPVVVVPVNDPTLMNAGKPRGGEAISKGEAPESDIEGNIFMIIFNEYSLTILWVNIFNE